MTDQQGVPGVPSNGGSAQFPPPNGAVPPPPPPPGYGFPPPPPGYRYPPAARPPRRSTKELWKGVAIGLSGAIVFWVAAAVAMFNGATVAPIVRQVFAWLAIAWQLGLIVGGMVLAGRPKTSQLGAGLLISVGVCMLLVAGTCGIAVFPIVPFG
jgi:hypothetical protein